jgi:adenylate cyclase
MVASWQIRIYDRQNLVFVGPLNGPTELGRQTENEGEPYGQHQGPDGNRLVIARRSENRVSRKHVLLLPLSETQVQVTNLSRSLPVLVEDGGDIPPGAAGTASLPAVLTVGDRVVRIQQAEQEPEQEAEPDLQSLAGVPTPPGHLVRVPAGIAGWGLPEADDVEVASLPRWLQAAVGVLQSAISSADFFQKAARALVDLVGLNTGRVLLFEGGSARVHTVETAVSFVASPSWLPSQQVVNKVLQEKRTFWLTSGPAALHASLRDVQAVVAAPILDRQGQVIGLLYGERRRDSGSGALPRITRLEASLVELLASGVAAGLARLEQEQAALALQIRFEQFFTPELARELAAHPDLLMGRDVEITVLFCDLRRFSRISERLGPLRTVEWLNDVWKTLSQCVLDHQGVLVDYIGDELMAMWGAPAAQPDHARRACHAGLDMLARLPDLNARWQAVLEEKLGLGIGINTGVARVGNMGSVFKFKYGPLGSTVNLASRVQGATRYLRTALLVTGATQAALGGKVRTRRLCKARVVNIAEPVDLFEVTAAGANEVDPFTEKYETALAAFEQGDCRTAAGLLGALIPEHPQDGPCLVLLSRLLPALLDLSEEVDPVWTLPGK